MTHLTRRGLIAAAAATGIAAASPARAGRTVRVGYQKYGNLLLLMVSKHLEEALKPLDARVTWHEFASGPPLLEALGAGAIDFGTAGETPPIFAQAAGAPLLYLGAEPPAPRGEAILVQKDSPIKSLSDLRGKKVGLNKGSNVHFLLLRALEKAGLAYGDITPVYLAPPDGRAAFERGAIDAWTIWDPYLAAAEATGRARRLADGTDLAPNHQFYFTHRQFTDAPIVAAFKAAVARIDRETSGDPRKAAAVLSPPVGLPEPVIAEALGRQSWDVGPMTPDIVARQQAIADAFFKIGLIPKAIRVADAVPA